MEDSAADRTEVQVVPSMFAPGMMVLQDYLIEAPLGVGGYALVVRARDINTDRLVAIKILRADVELDTETVERFLREAQAARQLRSEHVVRVDDVGQLDNGSPYIVMELLRGVDLGKYLARRGRLAPNVAADYLLQACEALAEAHARGIVHRDLKPTNMFVTRRADGSEVVKVLDFGVSKAPHAPGVSLTASATILGTPAYMPPEQMRSARNADARSDIWSLGAMLYELVEGKLPFTAETFGELCVVVAMTEHDPMITAPQLADVVACCLAKEPADRYRDVAALALDLAPFATSSGTHERVARIHRALGRELPGGADPALSSPDQRGHRRAVIASALAALVLSVVAGAVALRENSSASMAPPRAAVSARPAPPPAIAAPVAPPPSVAPPPQIAAPVAAPSQGGQPADRAPRPAATPAKQPPPRRTPPIDAPGAMTTPPPPASCDPFTNLKGC